MTFAKKLQIFMFFTALFLVFCINFILQAASEKNKEEIKNYFVNHYYSQFSIENQLKNYENFLETIVTDWAVWDDSYNFINSFNKKFIDSNFGNNTTLINMKIDGMFFFNKNKKAIYGRIVDKNKEITVSQLPDFLKKLINNLPKKYYLLKNNKIYLIIFHPVMTTDTKKTNGFLLVYKIITPKDIKGFDKVVFSYANNKKFETSIKDKFLVIRYKLYKNTPKIIEISVYKNISLFLSSIEKGKVLLNLSVSFFIIVLFIVLYLVTKPVLNKILLLTDEINKLPENTDLNLPVFKEKDFNSIVSTIKNVSKRINELLYYDQTCKMKNKNALFKEIKNMNNFSIAVINIGDFSKINSIYGYETGSEILCKIGRFLHTRFPFTYHIGEDRFVIIENIPKEEMQKKVKKIQKELNKKFYFKDEFLSIDIIAGIASMPEDTDDYIKVFEYANVALNISKGVNVFEKEMLSKSKYYINLERILRKAIVEKNFEIFYQPIIDIKKNKLFSAEALLRIKNQTVNIEDLIFIATQIGSINEITKIVLEKVFEDLKEIKKYAGLKIAVNLSSKDIENEDFVNFLQKLLKKHSVSHNDIALEITERDAIKKLDVTVKFINKIRSMQIPIEIDDFGVAYSSLNQLSKIDFDIIKIDKSFIDLVLTDKKVETITKFIIELTHFLNAEVIAEGVEVKEQVEWLKNNSCDYIQGYYFSKPLCKNDFIEWIRMRK